MVFLSGILKRHEYSVNEIRQSPHGNLKTAIDKAIEKMPRDFVNFIIGYRAEVKGMFLTEWDQEEALAQERIEGHEEGSNLLNVQYMSGLLLMVCQLKKHR